MKLYYVYMMASHRHVLYTGVTGPLEKRVWQHKKGIFPDSFSSRYRVHKLVYYESFDNPVRAINLEKQLKSWRREKKVALVTASNPKWRDLSASWGKPIQIPRSARNETLVRETESQSQTLFKVEALPVATVIRLASRDGANRLTRRVISELTHAIRELSAASHPNPLIITGNDRFFSVGADLEEIAALNAAAALGFSLAGQELMSTIEHFPAATCGVISGYCMGGGLDLALACRHRVAAPNAIFGHRGAALGLITGWGGTQRLPRLIGKGRAPQMFLAAEKLDARQALAAGVIDEISQDPLSGAVAFVTANKG
jgi:enoyl-CoA hydratase/carnithine racemase/predicted GIY-YIG superfamily endonuclease